MAKFFKNGITNYTIVKIGNIISWFYSVEKLRTFHKIQKMLIKFIVNNETSINHTHPTQTDFILLFHTDFKSKIITMMMVELST